MKNKRYLIYFIVILLSTYMSHLFYLNQTTYYKTDITIKIGRSYNSKALKPVLIEDIAVVIEKLRSNSFIFKNFSKEHQKFIPRIAIRTFRNGDSIVLSLVTKKMKSDEQTSYKKIMETLATSLIQNHNSIRKNIKTNNNGDYFFTKTHVTNKAGTYTHKKYTSYSQIIFLGIIIGVIFAFTLEKLIFFRKKIK